MNALEVRNHELHLKILEVIENVEARRRQTGFIDHTRYPLERVVTLVKDFLQKLGYRTDPIVEYVDRERFKADMAVRVPELLRQPGKEVFMKEIAPKLVEMLTNLEGAESVQLQGIYVNVKLKDDYFLKAAGEALQAEKRFGESSVYKDQRVIVEYSDPNAAKKLHAGHIRSTIIGEVLANIIEANGATTFRWNHPNDLGGFGFLLEGYRRWEKLLPAELSKNDQLAFLYGIRRTLEKLEDEKKEPGIWNPADRELAERCFGPISSFAEFTKANNEYTARSNEAFERLENGDPNEITLWSQMIEWSWEDFNILYDKLGVHFDLSPGESFYGPRGIKLVEESVKNGKAFVFTQEKAGEELSRLEEERAAGKISDEEYENVKTGIENSIGAVVVLLSGFNRNVILRSDGRSIYTTRDIGMLQYRDEVFKPSRVIYEVGQEQKEHFDNLFETGRKLGIVSENTKLEHVYHGFYVDAKTKKKLSSRDGAASVTALLDETIEHFENKYGNASEFSPEEIKKLARTLGVGSIVINDIRKDIRNNFEIAAGDLEKTIQDFEDSGGAYLIYTACRAKSIFKKFSGELIPAEKLASVKLEPLELKILKTCLQFPKIVRAVGESLNPATLVNYLFELAQNFNSFYAQYPVLRGGDVHMHRLYIVKILGQVLENGLRICDIETPERI